MDWFISEGKLIEYIPLKKNGKGVRCADKAEATIILKEFRQRSAEIKDDVVLREKYAQFAESYLESYLLTISGVGNKFVLRVINKLFHYRFAKWFIMRWYQKKNLLAMPNYVDCEAHNELLSMGLKSISF